MTTPLQAAVVRANRLDPQTKTEVMRGVYLRRMSKGDIKILTIHYSADPDRDPATPTGAAWYEREHGNYSSESAWQRELEIDANAGGGERVFATVLSKFYDVVVIDDPLWMPNPRWDVAGGFDHGKVNATALLKGYVDFEGNIYFAGEYYSMLRDGWGNEVADNAPEILKMPDIHRMKWCVADPSIWAEDQVQADGTFSSVIATYRKHGLKFLNKYTGEQSDVTFVEKMLSEYWHRLDIKKPRVYVVCRNPSDRVQPGLHPYDCPNLLWELKRARRAELTARQLMTRNPTEKIVDKFNHLRDCMKQFIFTQRRPAEVPLGEQLQERIKGMDPTSAQIAAQMFYVEKNKRNKSRTVSMRNKGRMR